MPSRYPRGMTRSVLVLASVLLGVSAPPAGNGLCVLTPADFRTLGIAVDARPSIDVDNGGASAYCVYRGKSGATGGVELDVFDPAGDSPDGVAQTMRTVLASSPGARYQPERLAGADESLFDLHVPQSGYAPFAANAVRRRDLVFSISLPSTAHAARDLERLSALVLRRLP